MTVRHDDVVEVELWRAPTPIPRPVLTAAGPYDTYWHLVVVLRQDGVAGWACSGMATEPLLDAACATARALVPGGRASLGALLGVEPHGVDTASRGATSALALAAWDLAARRLGVPAADLWGRRPGVDALDAYWSGFFLDAPLDELAEETALAHAQGFRFVKMRTGLALTDDVARHEVVAARFRAPGTVAVDAFHSWDATAARAFVHAVGDRLLWVEDATPYDDMAALHPLASPVASCESLETVADVVALHSTARLDAVLLDVQRLGGPEGWRRTAAALAPRGARIGAHVCTPWSLHLLAGVDEPLPVEVFDWSDALFTVPPRPRPDGRLALVGPGFGVDLATDALAHHGLRLPHAG